MSTYFNVVNLDKKEQASLVIQKSQKDVDATTKAWEKKNRRKWVNKQKKESFAQSGREYDPEGYLKQPDGSWTMEVRKFYHQNQKLVFGFIFWEACGDQWGHVSSWFGDRVVIICDTSGAAEVNSPLRSSEQWCKMDETYKPVKFYVSYKDWKDAQK